MAEDQKGPTGNSEVENRSQGLRMVFLYCRRSKQIEKFRPVRLLRNHHFIFSMMIYCMLIVLRTHLCLLSFVVITGVKL